jgi:hypothetical protein
LFSIHLQQEFSFAEPRHAASKFELHYLLLLPTPLLQWRRSLACFH